MSDKFPPIDNQRRRFQSLQSLLRSEEFINAEELAGKTRDSVTFSFPDLNSSLQHPANTEISSSEVGESGQPSTRLFRWKMWVLLSMLGRFQRNRLEAWNQT